MGPVVAWIGRGPTHPALRSTPEMATKWLTLRQSDEVTR